MPGRAVFDQHKPNALRDGLCNAMTTVSAVIFLHGPNTRLAAIAVVHMDESGQGSAAAAMACTILAITAGVKLVHVAMGGVVSRATQAWRQR